MATMEPREADQMVLDLIQKVKQRKAEIKAAQGKPNWLTTCTLGYNQDSVSDRINIQTVNKVEKIVDLYNFLLVKEEKWNQATKELGVDTPLVYMGYPVADWKADLKTRVNQLTIEKKKRELETLEKRLDGLVTVEQRRALELADIAKELE
jgi:LmbE family N-acetylglucosaminyl deacetylase